MFVLVSGYSQKRFAGIRRDCREIIAMGAINRYANGTIYGKRSGSDRAV